MVTSKMIKYIYKWFIVFVLDRAKTFQEYWSYEKVLFDKIHT